MTCRLPTAGASDTVMINDFVVIESVYGKIIVNRHGFYHAEHLIKTGKTHIEGELEKILKIVDTIREQPIIVDAGANIGFVSIPIAQAVKERGGQVHAFEPQRMLFNALCGSAALNDLDNLYVYNQAIGDSCGEIAVPSFDYGKPQAFGLCSLTQGLDGEKVPLTTIDSLNLPRLDFVKIDVEGMEVPVLNGARKTIEKHLPWCWVEYLITGIETINETFGSLPYQFYRMDNLNILCAPEPRMAASGITITASQT